MLSLFKKLFRKKEPKPEPKMIDLGLSEIENDQFTPFWVGKNAYKEFQKLYDESIQKETKKPL